jgi:hypothetical protein
LYVNNKFLFILNGFYLFLSFNNFNEIDDIDICNFNILLIDLLFDDYHFKDNDLVKFQNTPIKDELTKENIKQLIINEFKKCNGTNVLIFYLKPHYTPIDSSLHNFLITKIKNINIKGTLFHYSYNPRRSLFICELRDKCA